MHFLVGVQERSSRGATGDADEMWQEPAEVNDNPSISEERVSLTPGGEGGSRERSEYGSFCYFCRDVGLDIMGIVGG